MERFIIKYDPTLSSDPYQSQEYAIMEEESHGEYGKYGDYQLLEAKIAELEKENIELEECFDECYTELGKVQHELDKQVRSSGDKIAELEAMLASWKRTTHVEMKNMPRITKEQEIEAGL